MPIRRVVLVDVHNAGRDHPGINSRAYLKEISLGAKVLMSSNGRMFYGTTERLRFMSEQTQQAVILTFRLPSPETFMTSCTLVCEAESDGRESSIAALN